MIQNYIIGVDISKEKIDCALFKDKRADASTQVVKNDLKRIEAYLRSTVRKLKIDKSELLIVCENTGIYGRPLEIASTKLGLTLWVEQATKIKRATIDMRGKDDRTDSLRIAEYGKRYCDKQKAYIEPSEEIARMKVLTKVRETLIKERVRFENQLSESKSHDPFEYKILEKEYGKLVTDLKKRIKNINQQIENIISKNKELKKNRDLLVTITGIGTQTAINFILATNNFQDFESAKHLACYAGVVPFKNESGKIQKRARVSKMANKNLKMLLHLAAMAAIRCKGELRAYYLRRVKEGYNKMSILNAVRNKLVHRIMAVINRQTPYEPIETFSIKKEKNACLLT